MSRLHCANLVWKSSRTIHDNQVCDFKIGRPPYLPDLKEGAYIFWDWWCFRGLKLHRISNFLWRNDQIWSFRFGEDSRQQIWHNADSEVGIYRYGLLMWQWWNCHCFGFVQSGLIIPELFLYCANKHCRVFCQSTISAEPIKFNECYSWRRLIK